MRARILTHTLPLLCSSALLMACSSPPLQQAAQTVAASAADNYLRGRNLHLAHRYEEAIAAYQAALKADSSHVNARNGLAIAYAEQRDFAKAIPIWRELTHGATMASGTDTAFLFGNLGHAYFLNGQYDDALVALEKACLLDPLNHRTWQRLGETLQQLGQDERAGQMLRQASALRDHDFRADYAAADGGARLPAIEQALKTPQRPDQDWHPSRSQPDRTACSNCAAWRRTALPRPCRRAGPRFRRCRRRARIPWSLSHSRSATATAARDWRG